MGNERGEDKREQRDKHTHWAKILILERNADIHHTPCGANHRSGIARSPCPVPVGQHSERQRREKTRPHQRLHEIAGSEASGRLRFQEPHIARNTGPVDDLQNAKQTEIMVDLAPGDPKISPPLGKYWIVCNGFGQTAHFHSTIDESTAPASWLKNLMATASSRRRLPARQRRPDKVSRETSKGAIVL